MLNIKSYIYISHISKDWFDARVCIVKCYSFCMWFFEALFTFTAVTCLFTTLEEHGSPLGHTYQIFSMCHIHTATCPGGVVWWAAIIFLQHIGHDWTWLYVIVQQCNTPHCCTATWMRCNFCAHQSSYKMKHASHLPLQLAYQSQNRALPTH